MLSFFIRSTKCIQQSKLGVLLDHFTFKAMVKFCIFFDSDFWYVSGKVLEDLLDSKVGHE